MHSNSERELVGRHEAGEVLSLNLPGLKGGCSSHGKDKWEDTSYVLNLPRNWEHLGSPEIIGSAYFITSKNSVFRHLQCGSSYPMAVGNFLSVEKKKRRF